MPRWPEITLAERFWAKVLKPKEDGACWIWMGAKQGRYGEININRYPVRAHRVAWELTHGAIPEGLWVLHKCDVPSCVNPNHLFLGGRSENQIDALTKGLAKPPMQKLTLEQVHSIREEYDAGQTTESELSNKYGISGGQMSRIIQGKDWGDWNRTCRRIGSAKLTDADVKNIRLKHAIGNHVQKDLAKEYGIHPSLISLIVHRKIWRNVL